MINFQDYLFRIKLTSAREIVHRGKRLLLAGRLKKAALQGGVPVAVPPIDRRWVRRLKPPPLVRRPDDGRRAMPSGPAETLNTPIQAVEAFERDECRIIQFLSPPGHRP